MKISRLIAQLQADWINLHDLDRAAAVQSLHKTGLPIRQIAAQLPEPGLDLALLLGLWHRQVFVAGNDLGWDG